MQYHKVFVPVFLKKRLGKLVKEVMVEGVDRISKDLTVDCAV
jgi:hypothetical protein